MAVGKSNRIVVEVDPQIKKRIYTALNAQGMTLKDWFLGQAEKELLSKTVDKMKKDESDE